ncbi:MAG: CPBP family intramembrane metalloprotease [candidate division KSB1 bacterium]|nr:CPBP family intramembrane metalloprotease [candidate division KSB1 bacterium]
MPDLGGTIVLFIAVQYGIPLLQQRYGVAPLISWWLASGIIVFALFVGAILVARQRTKAQSLREVLVALNLRSMSKTDALWALVGLLGVIVLTGVVVVILDRLFLLNLLSQDSYASFLRMQKLKPSEYWLFLVWLPYFFFNIVGEELMWRGYLLPRQSLALGRYAWIFNGLLWAIFHSALGWRIAILLLPIELIVPYVVQRRQNTWLGIIIHGLYNGSAFVMVALGVGS